VDPCDPIDDEGLCGQEDHRDLDHHKFSWPGDDPESHDERSRTTSAFKAGAALIAIILSNLKR
jgi:hypothetical protein